MIYDIDFTNTGFFDNTGMDSSYTGGIFDARIGSGSSPPSSSYDENVNTSSGDEMED
jgi:hypothetical protein